MKGTRLPEGGVAVKDAAGGTRLLTPRKVATQLAGFAVGVVLLYLCVRGAMEKGDWERIRRADPRLVALLLGSTVASLLVNGTTFWITIRPVKRLRFWDLQRVNLIGNLLNYAPIRLGAVARVAYHLQVDGLGIVQIGAWFAFILYTVVLGLGAPVLATLIHDRLDPFWLLLVLVPMVAGGLAVRQIALTPVLARHGRGMHRIVRDPRSLWGAIVLRLLDVPAQAGRMVAAVGILGFDLPPTHVVILTVVAIGASMTPFGRVGIREWSVAKAAALLSMARGDVEGSLEQLALLESAGEAMVLVPAGALCLVWLRRKWTNRGV